MSSHHIVRDEQEPALILEDISSMPFDIIGQLLEWAPVVVCGDSALDQALNFGLNLDVVFAQEPEKWVHSLNHLPMVRLEKANGSWVKDALDYLEKEGHSSANIVSSKAESHFSLLLEMKAGIQVSLISENRKFVGVEGELKKWMPTGARLEVFADSAVEVLGAEWSGQSYIVKKEGMISVVGNHTPFVIGLTL